MGVAVGEGNGFSLGANEMRIIIARFAPWKLLPILLMLAMMVWVVYEPLLFPDRTPAGSEKATTYFIAQFLAPILILLFFALLWQAAFRSFEAIWIEKGELIQFHKWYFRVSLADIDGIDIGTIPHGPVRIQAVSLFRKNRQPKKLQVTLLQETAFDVYDRLRVQLEPNRP